MGRLERNELGQSNDMFYSFCEQSPKAATDTASFGDHQSESLTEQQMRDVNSDSGQLKKKSKSHDAVITSRSDLSQPGQPGVSGGQVHQGHNGDGASSVSAGRDFDAADDDLSSVSHGLAIKMKPATTPVRASMMKSPKNGKYGAPRKETEHGEEDDDDDDDFFDALDHFQALSYQKSSSKGPT